MVPFWCLIGMNSNPECGGELSRLMMNALHSTFTALHVAKSAASMCVSRAFRYFDMFFF